MGELLYYNIAGVYVWAIFRTLLPSLRAQRSNPSIPEPRRGLLRCARNDAEIVSHSRDEFRPRDAFRWHPLDWEGAGKTGCALHPRSRVPSAQKKTHTSIQVQRRHPAFPAQWFTAYFVLSPVNGSFATVAPRDDPGSLAPAPRRQDHTTSPSASGANVSCAIRVHRIPPRVRDDRERPSCRVGRGVT